MESKNWWKSKLIWLGVLEIAIGVVNYVATLDPGTSASAVIAGVLTIIFRYVTKQPLAK